VLKTGVIDIQEFDYTLPDERIAKYPLEKRDQSKLLIYNRGKINEDRFFNISTYISSASDLFFNNTRVIHARLKFRKQTGANIEIFCLNPIDPIDYQMAFSTETTCIWNCMVGNLGKWKNEMLKLELNKGRKKGVIIAEKLAVIGSSVDVKFSWDGEYTFSEIIEQVGQIPIPPYLNRNPEEVDNSRYQTIYSKPEGSVAAPTAGLHFTPGVLESLKARSVILNEITLHVGAGTFQPIKSQDARNHSMHSEFFRVERSIIEKLATSNNPLVSTGTTTMRTLESLYWLALKSIKDNKIHNTLTQWEYNEIAGNLPKQEAFHGLYQLMLKNGIHFFDANTAIMIVPGYKFRVTDVLITNFHQPKSTLLLLIAAFIGADWKKIYQYALEHEFRFLSYGDSSLLMK
jgi:S-adenosylmethionine:tRNA ribosyltransferase-isomerase